MDPKIFKAYDIRGVVPEQVDADVALRIGIGFARSGILPKRSSVVVGHDPRLSSEELSAAFARGLSACGVDVVDIGLCTTPMLYFTVNLLAAAGGAMVTASHNPSEYNGFKLVRENAIPIGSDSGLEKIKHEAAATSPAGRGPRGRTSTVDIREQYIEYFAHRFPRGKLARRLVIDTGNGAVGPILSSVLAERGINYTSLFFEPDGRFPNHAANPLDESTLTALRAEMRKQGGAIGVAFDGDGDRVCFLDEDGNVLRGDLVTALLGPRLLSRHGPSRVLYDLRSSRIVPEMLAASGGEPIKTRVGHAFVKALMRQHQALFAGELSYHFYFRDFFYCESGIYALLEMLSLVEESRGSLVELVAPLLRYAHSGEINFKIQDKERALAAMERHYSTGTVSRQDGLSVDFNDWWLNLRPSNTEPLLRLNVEALSRTLMEEKVAEIDGILPRYGSRCS